VKRSVELLRDVEPFRGLPAKVACAKRGAIARFAKRRLASIS
jgi:hypothetical protein